MNEWQAAWSTFQNNLQATTPLEIMAVIAGIVSVYYSRKEHILVYPIGLLNTIYYVYLSFEVHLYGEALVNAYYTIMSVIGWYHWTRKDAQQQPILQILFSTKREWTQQLSFFLLIYISLYFALRFAQIGFNSTTIPWADALASASAFTGMWLMTRKKVESWYWWIITNLTAIPLYYVKGFVFTGCYYVILLFMAVSGLVSWYKKAKQHKHHATAAA